MTQVSPLNLMFSTSCTLATQPHTLRATVRRVTCHVDTRKPSVTDAEREQRSLMLSSSSLLPSRVLLWPQYACMPVRKMVTGTRVCRTDDDCAAHSNAASVCVTPSLENQTRFIRVTHPPNTHMLFVGYPPHLQYAGTYRSHKVPKCLMKVSVFVEILKQMRLISGCLSSVEEGLYL